MSKELYERNREIYKLKLKGATYKELAMKYMLTQDRIFKIVRREKLRSVGLLKKK